MNRKTIITMTLCLLSFFCFSQPKPNEADRNETSNWQSLLLPALIAVGGYILKSIYEVMIEKEKRRRNLLEDKLKNFYWPILTRLEENNAIWKLILSKRQNRYKPANTTSSTYVENSIETENSTGYYDEVSVNETDNIAAPFVNENMNETEKKIGFYVEQNIVLKNHREIMAIIMTNRYLAKFDDALSKCLQSYFRHVAIYEGILYSNENTFPGSLGAPYPKEFDEIIEKRTVELQKKLDERTLL